MATSGIPSRRRGRPATVCGVSWACSLAVFDARLAAEPTARGRDATGVITTPLRLWFQAMWYVTNQKHGVSALGLQRILGLGSYQTAWAWLHKLRRAMVRPGRDLLGGAVDGRNLCGRPGNRRLGRQTKTKSIVANAAEVRGRGTGRRMSRVEDVAARSLIPSKMAPRPYQPTVVSTTSHFRQWRPGPHRHATRALDRWWLGPSMPTISTTISTSSLSDSFRLLQQAVQHEPVPYKGLVGGHRNGYPVRRKLQRQRR